MNEILVIVGIAAGAFIGTNLDNLLLLSAMYSRYEQRAWMVTAGYIAGMILIGGITLAMGEVGEFIPLAYLGLLGFIPMMMGVFCPVRGIIGSFGLSGFPDFSCHDVCVFRSGILLGEEPQTEPVPEALWSVCHAVHSYSGRFLYSQQYGL